MALPLAGTLLQCLGLCGAFTFAFDAGPSASNTIEVFATAPGTIRVELVGNSTRCKAGITGYWLRVGVHSDELVFLEFPIRRFRLTNWLGEYAPYIAVESNLLTLVLVGLISIYVSIRLRRTCRPYVVGFPIKTAELKGPER